MIDPGLVVFGVQALVRFGREGKKAIEQLERDRQLLFPEPLPVDFTNTDLVVRVFANNDATSALVDTANGGPLARFWDAANERPDPRVPGSAEVFYLEAVRIFSERAAKNGQILPLRGVQVAGTIIVQQWADGTAPVGPLGRMVLAIADIGLDFIGTYASVLGIGGNAEKLVAAVALNLADLIPDDGDQLGPKSRLSERLLGVFLRAGLTAIADQPELVIGAPHLRELVGRTLPPIVKELPQDRLTGTQQHDCLAEVVKLPATDRQEVLQVFSGFETEFKDARDVAHGMGNVGAGLADAAKNGQAILYCDAEKTWVISKRVEGMQQDRDALTCRRKRLDCLLTRSDADCADPCPSDEDNPVVNCQDLAGKPLPLPVQPAAPPG